MAFDLEPEFFECSVNMSKAGLYNLTYSLIMFHGHFTSSLTIGAEQYSKAQNSRNTAFFSVSLPRGQKEAFEKTSGIKLKPLQNIHLN